MKKLKLVLRLARTFGGVTGTVARAVLQILKGNTTRATTLMEKSGDRLWGAADFLWVADKEQ